MSDESDGVVVAVPVRDGETTSPIGGTDQDTCARCDAAVWVSQGTRLSIENGVYPDIIWCTPCAAEDAEADDE